MYISDDLNEVIEAIKKQNELDLKDLKDYEKIFRKVDSKKVSKEAVNHPKHYNRDGAMECIDEMITVFGIDETMSYCKLNAWKYRYRAADKNGEEDLKKSDWYIKKYRELKNEKEKCDLPFA